MPGPPPPRPELGATSESSSPAKVGRSANNPSFPGLVGKFDLHVELDEDSGPKRLSPGQLLGERYRLVRRIGSGGMGQVWEAVHVVIQKPVAVKVLLDDEAAPEQNLPERFMREAHAIAAVRHENIVDITDFGHTQHGSPYFVMELLAGRTLKEAVKSDGAFSWDRARPLLLQLVDGLEAVHASGIVHRDLKPDNVFVVPRGVGRESCKIIDFGIAKVTMLDRQARAFTRTGLVFGTPAFMSPEQARGEKVDTRADIYAFGCLAYEILSGQRAFHGETPTEILFKQLFTQPVPLCEHDHTMLPEVEAIVLRCLRKDPDLRFGSMAEIRQALLAVGTGAPAVSVPQERLSAPPGFSSESWASSSASLSDSSFVTHEHGSLPAPTESMPAMAAPRVGRWMLLGASLLLLAAVATASYVQSRRGGDAAPGTSSAAPVGPKSSAVPPSGAALEPPLSPHAAAATVEHETADVATGNGEPEQAAITVKSVRQHAKVSESPSARDNRRSRNATGVGSHPLPSLADGSAAENPDAVLEDPPAIDPALEGAQSGPIQDGDLFNPFAE